MLRDRARALSCCAAGSTIYFADMEPDELGSNHQDWTRLPLIGDASHLLNRGRTFLSAVCHALASRCLLLQEAMGGRMLQATLTAHMSVGALCVRSLCTLSMFFFATPFMRAASGSGAKAPEGCSQEGTSGKEG